MPQPSDIWWRTSAPVGSSTPCDSWQVEHTGPSALPAFSAVPCALSFHSRSTPLWQLPQVAGTLAWWVREPGSDFGSTSCLPWQLEQDGATSVSPDLSKACACTLRS